MQQQYCRTRKQNIARVNVSFCITNYAVAYMQLSSKFYKRLSVILSVSLSSLSRRTVKDESKAKSEDVTVALVPVQTSSLSQAESRLERHLVPRDLNYTTNH